MMGVAMSCAAAADLFRAPLEDFIQQAHAALMRNVAFDPGAI
jgi:hypothetical protein